MYAFLRLLACLLVLATGLSGCGLKRIAVAPQGPLPDMGIEQRAVSEGELLDACERDPELTPGACHDILARLNIKDPAYIRKDVAKGIVLTVPNDFSSYKTWTPLPRHLPQVARVGKFVLVVKNIPFLGWYEKGRLKGDTQICIGKKREWTRAGLYSVMDKDPDHISQSYRSAMGYPALMPFALQIYGRVWVHGGDVVGGYCSHGCINLPLETSEKLFQWADKGTIVLIVDSLEVLHETLEKQSTRLPRSSKT
jgi:hypothetical protein